MKRRKTGTIGLKALSKPTAKAAARPLVHSPTLGQKPFHDWRKWVKYLSLQLAALAENGFAVDAVLQEKSAQLAERLGNYHDLDNLRRLA